MGFWNALSVLAPVAPALSDAQDIRAQRQKEAQELAQQAAAFPKEQALRDAQLTASKLAAQGEQQRLAQSAQPVILGEPQWNPTTHSNQVLTFDRATGALALKDAPGVDPSAAAAAKYAAAKADYKKTAGRDLSPEEDDSLFFQAYGFKPPTAKVTPLSGAAGQPQEYPKGSGQFVVFGRNADGSIIAQPVPAGFTPPAAKPLSPAVRFTNLMTKQILASQKKGPALTPEESAELAASKQELTLNGISTATARAVENARYGITPVTDESGEEVVQTRLNAVNAANSGTPFAAGAVGAPTGLDKKNQMLAQSALTQIDSMERVLAADPNLTGPGGGQFTRFQTWLGSNSPASQQFLAAATFLSEHGVGVFGGRNIHSITDLQNLMGSLKTNPAALKAALEQARLTMTPWATASGRLPAPKVAGANGLGNAPAKQHSLRTAMALSFNAGKTAAQVKADLESHGYTVVP
jgi:hypothetical protein